MLDGGKFMNSSYVGFVAWQILGIMIFQIEAIF
jgi:hypothetical protein